MHNDDNRLLSLHAISPEKVFSELLRDLNETHQLFACLAITLRGKGEFGVFETAQQIEKRLDSMVVQLEQVVDLLPAKPLSLQKTLDCIHAAYHKTATAREDAAIKRHERAIKELKRRRKAMKKSQSGEQHEIKPSS